MHLNRGNHEDHIMNLRYGFTKEVMQKYKTHGCEILQLFQDVFSLLPVATVIDGKVLIVHGGISDQTDLDFLSTIERHKVKSALRFPRRSLEQLDIGQSCRQMKRMISTDGSRPSSSRSHSKNQRSPNQRKRRCRISRQDSAVSISTSSSSSSSSSSSLCSPRTPSCLTPRPCPSSPSMTYTINVLHVPFLDSLTSVPHPPSPQHDQEWKQVITIFSASNYYEEGSNRGAYIKLGRELVPRFYQYQVSRTTRKLTLTQRVRAAEGSALRALKEKLFTHRSELMSGFQQYDQNNTGSVSVSEWAQVLESVLRLDLPWRTLRPHLARLAADGSVEYQSCFENMEPGIPLSQVTPNLAETLFRYRTDIEIIFNIIDKDHSGLISIEEFRQTWRLFSAHLGVDIDDRAIDDLARSIDFNKDGSIDFTEFLEAFRVVHKLDNKDQQVNGKMDGEKYL
ncbi:Serine/threonine-protein phosphatase with EF-hands 1 [Collichthys lucidus]|uniref:Serine/threonine-protein phosphatase n=1 Tax=Collichthys lucidus TaxID=240159 RepID=A0A4U5U5V7_COLLU|nr:Serine/threonine-protein phosphatase with EF-hands 1 [Collichthys lucidus]